MNDPETKPDADVIPLPTNTPVLYPIPERILAQLREQRDRIKGLQHGLGVVREGYLAQEAGIMRDLSKAEQTFELAAKSALMAAGADVAEGSKWDLDLERGEARLA